MTTTCHLFVQQSRASLIDVLFERRFACTGLLHVVLSECVYLRCEVSLVIAAWLLKTDWPVFPEGIVGLYTVAAGDR